MFRKTFIRLALLVIIISAGLIVFAASKVVNQASNRSCEAKAECEPEKSKSDFYILESLGRSILSSARY
jgi:hypothetical protein